MDENQCLAIENDMKIGRYSKRAYRLGIPSPKRSNEYNAEDIHIIEKKGILVKDDTEILNRWSEYRKDLYNYQITLDRNLLSNRNSYSEISPPIIKSEVEQSIRSIQKGKAAGVDNIPVNYLLLLLFTHGGEEMLTVMTTLCQQIWKTQEWPDKWSKSLIITIPKKGDLKKCEHYRTISLICHASKILLRIINRMNL